MGKAKASRPFQAGSAVQAYLESFASAEILVCRDARVEPKAEETVCAPIAKFSGSGTMYDGFGHGHGIKGSVEAGAGRAEAGRARRSVRAGPLQGTKARTE